MNNKMLIALVAISALLTLFVLIYAIRVLSRQPTAFEVMVLLMGIFVSAMALIYTSLRYINRNPPL